MDREEKLLVMVFFLLVHDLCGVLRDCISWLDSSIVYLFSGHNEVKNPLSAKGPGTISLNPVKTSVDILALDTARKAVQIPHPLNLDYKLSNPRSMVIPTMPSYLGNKALTFSSQHISPGFEQLAFTPELNHIWQYEYSSLFIIPHTQFFYCCSTSVVYQEQDIVTYIGIGMALFSHTY